MVNKIRAVIFLSFLASVSTLWAGKEFPQQAGESVVANQFLIKLKAGTLPAGVIQAIFPNAQTTSLSLPNYYLVRVPTGLPAAATAALAAHALVEYVEPDRVRKVILANPNDPGYTNVTNGQWGLFNVQAVQAWSLMGLQYLTSASAGTGRVKVAVLDTGADCTHPDFKNAGGTSTDSAAGGQLLWNGSQALVATTVSSPACAWQDDFGHGTHVTGIIAAATSNGAGVASLGYPLQVLEYKVLDASGSGSDSTIANAIIAAANSGAQVISMSLGGAGYSQTLQSAVNYAWQKGSVVVAAAGNSATGALFFPAGANHAVGVSATDINNALANFSNFGNDVSLAAPGVGILSTIPTYSTTIGCCNYGSLNGTSMATPFVSALAGLIAMTTPGATGTAIVQRLEQSSIIPGGTTAWNQSFGYGIINAYNAVAGSNRAASSGGIVGQIVDATGNPVSNAQVTIAGQTVTTDVTGLYWLRPVTAGTYPASVTAAGFPTQSLSVTVAPGADTPFTVAMGVSYGSITGTVTDQGAAVPGMMVHALSGGNVVGVAVADASGQYTLWVPAGAGYVVQASQIGFNTVSLSPYTVVAGAATTVNITVTSLLGAIAGTVRDTNGNLLSGAQVSVTSSNYTGNTVTAANGTYSVGRLPAGTYSVTASTAVNAPSTQTGVAVSADTTTTVNFQLAAPPGAAPTFSPAGGTYAAAQTISIASTTPGASIRYTLDGSTPSTTVGTLYSGPIAVAATTTINAIAYTGSTAPSAVTSSTYTINAGAWYSTGGTWNSRKAITINHAQVAGSANLTNFPVLISVTDANLQSAAKADGSDILFTGSDGVTKLNHEIDQYSGGTGQLSAWVNVPVVSPTSDAVIYMYYGNAAASSQQNAAGVWSNGYRGVWHLKDGSTLSVGDSSGSGTVAANGGSTAAGAKIGGGAGFNGSSQYISMGSNAALDIAPAVTVSLWFNYTTADSNARRLFMKEGRYASWLTNTTINFGVWGTNNATWTYGGAMASGAWHYLTGVADPAAGTTTLYIDGVQRAQVPTGTLGQATGNTLELGRYSLSGSQYFWGLEDEFRVANVARTAGWVGTEYNNQNAPGSFVTMAAQENHSSSVTVASSPAGLSLTVDGTPCTSPCALAWTSGTSHTIAAGTQAGAAGVQYVFASWSDNGAASHTVTGPATATTYTASFTTQYQLTTSANPGAGGTISPASGFYNAGAVVAVSASANSGYQFTGFSGALTGTTTPQNVTMNGAASVTANFSATTAAVTVASSPAGLSLTVDGTPCTSPCGLVWTIGSSHTIAAGTQAGAAGVQYVFASWSDNGAASHTVTGPATATTYTASFTTQYQLTTSASPGAGGTISPVSGFYNAGAVVAVSASANSGYQFTGFSGALTGTTSPQNVTMSGAASVTANFSSTTAAVTVASSPAGLSLTVDGTPCTSPCGLVWTIGSSHTIAAGTQAGAAGVQYVFASWSDNGAASHTVTGPATATTYTASFTTQYQLTTSANPGAGGTISPASGFYNAGAVVAVSASANSGYQFTGFSGALTGTTTPQNVTMNGAASVTANFSVPTVSWYSTGGIWSNRKAITINHAQVAGAVNLTNFPVLISLTDANLQSTAKTDGSDILFTAADGVTKLNHEVDQYSGGTGQLSAWVNVPVVSPTSDAVIYMYYGNAAASSQQNAAGVWSNGYRGVWHLKDGSTLSVGDSSGSGTVAANGGSTPAGAKIGGGAGFNGSSQYISMGSNAALDFAPAATVSLWFNYTTADSNARRLFMKEGRYASWLTNTTINFGVWGNNATWTYGGSMASGAWHYLTGVADPAAGTTTLYIDGVQRAQVPIGTLGQTAGNTLELGRYAFSGSQYFWGLEDEFRVANVARTAGWVGTEYNNQNAPGAFVAVAAQESNSSGTTAAVTVASSPAGLSLTVDGTPCTSPCGLVWTTGTSHTIAAGTQAGAAGVQYAFASWSDNGAASHTVTGPATSTTYTASFTTQYQLTTSANPGAGGSISPASGFYNAGAVVAVSASANSGYQFTGFSGALTGTTTPQNVTMNGAASVTANFSTSTAAVTVASSPAGLSLTVDGTPCTSPCGLVWTIGSSHTIAAGTQAGAAGVQYVFASWSDNGAASHTVTGPATATTYTASFTTQYQLTTSANPGAGGTISPASGFYNAGAVVAVSASASSGYQFTGFSGALTGTTTPQNVTMNGAASVTANFSVPTVSWYSTGGIWSNRKAITINHAQVAGAVNLTNFPVLISLTDANLQSTAKTDGSDILFTAADGVTKLNHEVDQYSGGTGQLSAWVNVPVVSPASDAVIYMYYGNAASSSQQNAAGVWSNGYRGVWHLKDGSTLSVGDSSGSATATTNGGSTAAGAKIGGGAGFNGSSQYISMGTNAALDFAPAATVSLWFNYTTADSNARRLFMKEGRYASWLTNTTINFGVWGNNATWTYGGSMASGAWHYLTGVADPAAGTTTLYIDGVQRAQVPIGTLGQTAGNTLDLGRYALSGSQYFWGLEDEFRVANVARTSGWVTTEYNNQNAPGSFVAVAAQESNSSGTTAAVTVASSPAGLSLTVDGTPCTSPCGLVWTTGTSHTIAAGTQAGAAGVQYVFASWSDNGAASHTVTGPATATTYTASFTTQYQLTTSANPGAGGSISPASGFYNAGAVVAVSASANSGYQFTGFSGALTGTTTPQNVTMNGAASVTANFSTSTAAVTVASSPAGLSLTVDGTPCTSPCGLVWTIGSSHTIAAGTQAGAAGVQYVFASWSDNGAASHTVTGPATATTYTASFTTQYQLTTSANPGAGGSISPASGFYNAGAVVAVSATANSGYQFTGFSGALTGTTTPQNVTMNSAASVTANFSVPTVSWYTTGGIWSSRKAVTINHAQVAGSANLTNFPVLISLTDANLQSTAKADGSDILFTAADGVTKLNHEIDQYSGGTGQISAWVNVPVVSPSSDAVIYMYYGNAAASSQQNAAGVWSNGYRGVWHLKDGSTLSVGDSSGSATATTNGGSTAAGAKIGGGAGFNGSSQYISMGTNAALDFAPAATVSLWFNYTTADGNARRLFMKEGRYVSWLTNTTINFGVWGNNATWTYGGSMASGAWHYLTGVADPAAGTTTLYIDGVQRAQVPIGTLGQTAGNTLELGRYALSGSQYFWGLEDEFRVANVARTSGWVTTEYNNQNAPGSFVAVAAQESNSNGTAVTVTSSPAGLSLTVDGTSCTSPCVAVWAPGSSHSIAAASQSATGAQYTFGTWSDNGAASHAVTAPSTTTTYTAQFAALYQLTTSVSPGSGGTISPVTGWYNAGAVVAVSATPATGYQFTGFGGALRGTTTQNLTMNAPAAVNANFGNQTLAGTGCTMFPANNVWNTPIDQLPVDTNSAAYVNTIGAAKPLHPDFGTVGGIPFLIVPATQPGAPITFTDGAAESEPGPYPFPPNAPIEPASDQHVVVLQTGTCKLYETWLTTAHPDGSWTASSGAVFDMNSNQLRPDGWTSSDAAGLPILPGLVRYEEVAAGAILHAIRMTAPQTRNAYIWPARHQASFLTGAQYPPMGQRFRLKADFDITPFPADVQVILTALKKYGMILADNGSSWFMTGAPDSRWNDDTLHQLTTILGSQIEAVDESSLMADPNSGIVSSTGITGIGSSGNGPLR